MALYQGFSGLTPPKTALLRGLAATKKSNLMRNPILIAFFAFFVEAKKV